MILRRLGNKTKIAHKIQGYFPHHTRYIEPFFGAGGMFFNKPKAKYNFLNDIDDDVFNLYQVLNTQKEEFRDMLENTPYHSSIYNNLIKTEETDPVKKAVRFIFLSNFGYMGKVGTLHLKDQNSKKRTIEAIDKTASFMKDLSIQFTSFDFEKAIKAITIRTNYNYPKTFIYCDPPYQGTGDNYSHSFTNSDFIRLCDVCESTGFKFAISEFADPFVIAEAEKRGYNVIQIGERQTMKNRQTEILLTNYQNNQTTLF